jgi:hypothetical protein
MSIVAMESERMACAMSQGAARIAPGEIDYEYETAFAGEVPDVRGYLLDRRRQGWKLFWIEGRSLHFRRRTEKEGAALAA